MDGGTIIFIVIVIGLVLFIFSVRSTKEQQVAEYNRAEKEKKALILIS